MPFTALELANKANAALDFYVRGPALAQSIQDKPLLKALMANQKTFPGGKENISVPVKGDYTTTIEGYNHNDSVSYANPANIKRAAYPWKEIHAGISLTHTELHADGISVVDSTTSKSTTEHSERELTVLTGLLEDKLDDMAEGWARGFNTMLWRDGTQDSKEVPGIRSMITNAPTTGTVGGLDRATFTWWRNRVSLAVTPSASSQTLSKLMRSEARQLRRYGARDFLLLAGSDFLEALDLEVAEKGSYTLEGFSKKGNTEIGLAEVTQRGLGTYEYDPTLDDLGLDDYCFVIDRKHIKLWVMDGEDKKTHAPARPADQYVMYRAMTWVGGLVGQQFNGCGVYSVV